MNGFRPSLVWIHSAAVQVESSSGSISPWPRRSILRDRTAPQAKAPAAAGALTWRWPCRISLGSFCDETAIIVLIGDDHGAVLRRSRRNGACSLRPIRRCRPIAPGFSGGQRSRRAWSCRSMATLRRLENGAPGRFSRQRGGRPTGFTFALKAASNCSSAAPPASANRFSSCWLSIGILAFALTLLSVSTVP